MLVLKKNNSNECILYSDMTFKEGRMNKAVYLFIYLFIGRPRITTRADDKFLRLQFLRNPFMTVPEVKLHHPHILGHVSKATLWHRLRVELKLPLRKAAKKPLLTARMRRQRIEWCKKYKNWTKEQWSKVIYILFITR